MKVKFNDLGRATPRIVLDGIERDDAALPALPPELQAEFGDELEGDEEDVDENGIPYLTFLPPLFFLCDRILELVFHIHSLS